MKSEMNVLTELCLIFMVTYKKTFNRVVNENNKISNLKSCFKHQLLGRRQKRSPYQPSCHGEILCQIQLWHRDGVFVCYRKQGVYESENYTFFVL